MQDSRSSPPDFEEIVGESPALKQLLNQARKVAPSDATVLILGERGTGKELVARAIHRMSRRRNANFVKLNCSAIPASLLESELFGHEKSAFSSDVCHIVGGLESANQGTLFLDQIGDLPPELQRKLLRVLQDGKFERLGSNRTVSVDIRLLAATNRDLETGVGQEKLHPDLYYRLSVFPVHVPALRDRAEDIPLLARYFAQKHARRMNKRIETITVQFLQALIVREWPGNVRELENVIKRSVSRSEGTVLDILTAELHGPAGQPDRTREEI